MPMFLYCLLAYTQVSCHRTIVTEGDMCTSGVIVKSAACSMHHSVLMIALIESIGQISLVRVNNREESV